MGEIASDPKVIPLLIGLGIRELSVRRQQLSHIRSVISQISVEEVTAKVESYLLNLATQRPYSLFGEQRKKTGWIG